MLQSICDISGVLWMAKRIQTNETLCDFFDARVSHHSHATKHANNLPCFIQNNVWQRHFLAISLDYNSVFDRCVTIFLVLFFSHAAFRNHIHYHSTFGVATCFIFFFMKKIIFGRIFIHLLLKHLKIRTTISTNNLHNKFRNISLKPNTHWFCFSNHSISNCWFLMFKTCEVNTQ